MEGEVGDKPGAAVGDFVAGVADGGLRRELEDGGKVRQWGAVGGEFRSLQWWIPPVGRALWLRIKVNLDC